MQTNFRNIVKQLISTEVKKIDLSEEEIFFIYKQAKEEKNSNLLELKEQELKKVLQKIEKTIEELYQDKINKIIQIDDFKNIYENKQKEKNKIKNKIKELEKIQEKYNQELSKIDLKKIIQIANEFLKMNKLSKIILERLIEKIEFDKNKNIKIKLAFRKI